MKCKYLRAGIWILMLISLTSLVAQAAKEVKVTLTFQPVVQVSGNRIYLAEIAELNGDSAMVQELKDIDLGPTPPPGGQFTLAPTMIYALLHQYGVAPEDIRIINLPTEGILVQGAGQKVDPERVLPAVEQYVYNQLPYSPKDIQIQQRSNMPEVWIPPGDYHVEVGPYRGRNLWGIISLPVSVYQMGKEYRQFSINLEVNIFQDIFVSTQTIQRLSIITADQVEKRYTDITRIHGEPIYAAKEVVGKQARRSFPANTILVDDYLQDQIIVERNDQVTIRVRYGGVRIETLGKALEDGAKGQWVWVENLSSGTEVQALVVGDGIVQVQVN